MTVSTITAGLVLAVIYAGLEIIEIMNEKEKKNSKTLKKRMVENINCSFLFRLASSTSSLMK